MEMSVNNEVARIVEETAFSGVVRIEDGDRIVLCEGYGLSDRAYGVANTVETQFGTASGAKGFTALTVVSLIEEGRLELATTARSILGSDLPLIGGDVTVEDLLSHRSGIGDYIDEDAGFDPTDYLMPVPVHELATTEQYVKALEGHPAKFDAGDRFSYCNSGYVVLALIAERVSGTPFHDLVQERVCRPAGLRDTAFLRSDELSGRVARGYLDKDGLRTNTLHLPVRGSGDGGIYTTVADVRSFWVGLFAGEIVSTTWVAEMLRPRSDVPSEQMRYGLGFWLGAADARVILEGYDAGVSFRSVHDPTTGSTWTVVSNTSDGAWPLASYLDRRAASSSP